MFSRIKFDISGMVTDIYSKIPQEMFESDVTTFVDIQAAGLQFIIPLIEILRKKGHSDDNIRNRVYAYAENDLYLNYVMFKYKDLPITYKIYDEKINMKFDVVIGNPPYNKQVGPKKTEPVWPKFVEKSFDMCKEDGYVSLIHPNGWRNFDGKFNDIQKLLLSKCIKYINMNSPSDGVEVFKAQIAFDYYLIQNKSYENGLVDIVDYDDKLHNIDIRNFDFIPNSNIDLVYSLVAKEGEETVKILHSYSDYETRKNYMSKVRTEEHIYPCVYTVKTNDTLTYFYSNKNDNGHFGVPKVIWGNGASYGVVIDENGEYGLTQFSYAIVDEPNNLPLIKKVLQSKCFIQNIMGYYGGTTLIIFNRKIISTFRKDFWKEFLDENNNVIEPKLTNVK